MRSTNQLQTMAIGIVLLMAQTPTMAQQEDLGAELGRYFQALRDRTTQVVAAKADELQEEVEAERLRRTPPVPDSSAEPGQRIAEPVDGQGDQGGKAAGAGQESGVPGGADADGDGASRTPVRDGRVAPDIHQVTWVPQAQMKAMMSALREKNWQELLPLLRHQTGYDSVLVVRYDKVSAEIADHGASVRKLKADLGRDIAILGVFAEDAPERQDIELRIQGTRQALADCEAEVARRMPEQERLLQAACRKYLLRHAATWRVARDNQ